MGEGEYPSTVLLTGECVNDPVAGKREEDILASVGIYGGRER
jgi:hypothetical protein